MVSILVFGPVHVLVQFLSPGFRPRFGSVPVLRACVGSVQVLNECVRIPLCTALASALHLNLHVQGSASTNLEDPIWEQL